jgi:hypothetical protein
LAASNASRCFFTSNKAPAREDSRPTSDTRT